AHRVIHYIYLIIYICGVFLKLGYVIGNIIYLPFTLKNKATGFCLVKKFNLCADVRWTSGDRLFVVTTRRCLGAQGKSVGSEVSFYDCDDKSDLQKWECKNETLLVLKGQQLYVEIKPDETVALSKTVGPNNQLTITGTSSGACSITYRELYTIEGNAFGKPCMFPFLYKDRWFGDCTTFDSSSKRPWCAVRTKYENEQWGYCPTASTDHWGKNRATGAYYQLNTQSVLTWAQAETSCKQQGASLLSVTDPHAQAFISGKQKLWIGLVLNPEHGWQWSDGKPFRYLRWAAGNPLPNPGHNCAFLDSAGQHTWQTLSCSKKLGYICYKDGIPPTPPQIEQGFCSNPWIPYNGHCFHLNRSPQTWSNAQKVCRKEGGDLVSIRNVEDQSFVISQLGFASNDKLWIGLNDIKTERLFDWSDHSTVSFTSWAFGKPSVSSDAEDCVLITGENGNWEDSSCEEKNGFICMMQSATEPTEDEINVDIGCKVGWKRHGSYCYFVGMETKTFDEAKNDCKASDSYLADVSNGVDNAFLVSLVGLRPEKYFWLGLSNQNNIDNFVWTNGNLVSFTHWNAQMPGYQQGCVAITTGTLAGLWDLLPCTNTEKYICKHMAEGAVLTVPPPTQTPPKCAEGWTRVGTRSYCSKFFTGPRSQEKTWFEAQDFCRAIGGDLLSIHSSVELSVARYELHGKAWIGLHMPDPSTGYVWSDGSPVNFLHWQEGEPNNHNNDESCAEFKIYNWDESGSWNDLNCDSYNDWLCQIRLSVKINCQYAFAEYNMTSDGWIKWKGNQYYLNQESMYMDDARHFCKQRRGDLVSITSKEENIFLWKQISRNYGSYYIGLSVDLDGSSWWMDGSPVGLQRWDENQPNYNNFDANCVTMTHYMGFWRTCNCGQEQKFICKRTGSVPANTTAAPTVPPKGGCPLSVVTMKPPNVLHQEDCVVMTSSSALGIGKWLIKSCNDTSGFICHRNVDPNIPSQSDTAISNIYVTLGNDTTLVSLRNEWTQAYIELLVLNLNAPVWIGLNKQQTGGYFKYIDNWHLNFASWAENEPSSDKPCVYLDVDGKWRTAFCNETMYSVCMQTADVPPTESTNYPGICPEDAKEEYHQSYTWLPFKGHCYLFITDEIEWANAASSCVRHGKRQATHRRMDTWYISYSLNLSHRLFLWLDNTAMDYSNWATDEPDSDYGEINTADGTWKSGRRWHDRGYICETPKGKMFPHGGQDPRSRAHTSLIYVLIITAISTLMIIAFFIYKKNPRPLPTFTNPLYFDSERSQPDVVDTNKLIENAEVEAEDPEPIITL
uniref:Uncharacterized protein n=1 Tax=Mola mola TaxID=94237 RepID=A0A3Q3W748_MOLML